MPGDQIWRRLTAEWQIKLLLGGAITALFWIGYFRLEQGSQRRVYRRTPFTGISSPDFGHLVLGLGLQYVRTDADIEPALTQALAADTSVLVEVNVNYAVPPPYIQGAGRQMFRNLPARLQTGIALRLAKRHCFPPPNSAT